MLKTVVHQFFLCFFLTQQDGSGTITIKEFEKGFHVETTKALFEALGLKAEDAWTLFRSLDKDGGKNPTGTTIFHAPASNYRYIKEPGRESLGCFWPLFVRWCLLEIALSDRTVTIGLERRNLCKGALTLVVPLDK